MPVGPAAAGAARSARPTATGAPRKTRRASGVVATATAPWLTGALPLGVGRAGRTPVPTATRPAGAAGTCGSAAAAAVVPVRDLSTGSAEEVTYGPRRPSDPFDRGTSSSAGLDRDEPAGGVQRADRGVEAGTPGRHGYVPPGPAQADRVRVGPCGDVELRSSEVAASAPSATARGAVRTATTASPD